MSVSLEKPATKASLAPVRSARQLVLFALGLLLLMAATVIPRLISDAQTRAVASPFSFKVEGLVNTDSDRINVIYISTIPDIGQREGTSEALAVKIPGEFEWTLDGGWIKAVQLSASQDVLNKITAIDVSIGDQHMHYAPPDLNKWKRVPTTPYALNDRSQGCVTLEMPPPPKLYWPVGPAPIINWPPTGAVMARIVIPKLVFFSLALLSAWLFWRLANTPAFREFQSKALAPSTHPQPQSREWPWLLAGFAAVVIGLAIFLRAGSSAFTQDDNLAQFLPVVQESSKALFAGHFPTWNPHQQLGAPTTTVGTYMLTYPPTYIAWWIADKLLGDENLTMNVFALLHLIAGYFVAYWALRKVGVRPSISAAGSMSFILSGFLLIAGRSQFTFIPLAVFAPPLLVSPYNLIRAAKPWKWAITAGLIIGIFFHAGHAQMWAYGVVFFIIELLLLAVSQQLPWQRALWGLPALCCGIAIAAPLLLLQLAETQDMFRNVDSGIPVELLRTLIPFGSLGQKHLAGQPTGTHLYYSGTLFAATVFIGLWMILGTILIHPTSSKKARELLGANIFLILTGIAILLSIGDDGLLWTLQSQLPVFNKFRWPVKYAGYFIPLMAIAGGLILERVFRPKAWKLEAGILAAVSALMLIHCALIDSSWYDYGFRPYPKLPAGMAEFVTGPETNPPGRVLASLISMSRHPSPSYFDALPLNFPTKAGAYAVGGYDIFVENAPEYFGLLDRFRNSPVEAAKAYGVQWVIGSNLLTRPELFASRKLDQMEMPSLSERRILMANAEAGVPAFTAPDVTVVELKDTSPYAFTTDAPHQALPINFDTQGAEVDVEKVAPGKTVITNVLWRWLKATVAGSPLPAAPDNWGRVAVTLPNSTSTLRLTYAPPWTSSSLAGLALLIVGILSGLLLRKFLPKASAPCQPQS